MDAKLIAAAIPVFFVLIAIERLVAHRRRVAVYRFHDAVADLSCGIGQQMTLIFSQAPLVVLYLWIYEDHRLVTWSEGWLAWVLAFVLIDFAYYWWHRLSHEVNFLWAAHIVHHQSEDYNLAVALRQALLTNVTSFPFYAPLAVLGIPPLTFAVMLTASTLYQFWIHTELIRKMGWFERAFNTPSHHRVHHAINPQYLDRNYAATLIVWDRLFGSFEPEEEQAVYGITKPLNSFNMLWANAHYWVEMWRLACSAKTWWERVQVPFRGPAWRPKSLGGPVVAAPVTRAAQRKYDVSSDRWRMAYVTLHFVGMTGVVVGLIAAQQHLPRADAAAAVGIVFLTLLSWSGLAERKRWAKPLEGLRLLAVVSAPLMLPSLAPWALPLAIAFAVLGVAGLPILRRFPR
jgi:alkylglycerol monooxygenase